MNQVQVNFDKKTGIIKPMHGVGQPPIVWDQYHMFDYLKDAMIPFSRLHDVAGAYGGNRYVDIPNLFRDFEADPYDPESYVPTAQRFSAENASLFGIFRRFGNSSKMV